VSANSTTLPIFPLAVVLVPGELLPLHIFEERYKSMMADALEGERRFGLSYAETAEVGGDAVPEIGSVGCVAQISAVVPLPEGRMNVLAIGAGRYIVRDYVKREPFLVAEVELLSDDAGSELGVEELADEVRELFGRLTVAARTLSSESSDDTVPTLDAEPESLSFLVAANVALDNDAKQRLLEMTDTRRRLEFLRDRLVDLVDTYEYRAEMHVRTKSNGHGHLSTRNGGDGVDSEQ
jgi:Lon protease-like protein